MGKRWMAGLMALACAFGVYLLVSLPPKEREAGSESSFAVPDKPVDADAAMQNYKASCLSCHGAELKGGFGPELDKVGATMTKERIYKQIEQGGGGMPKFEGRLTEDQLVNITNWLAGMK